MMLTPKIFPTRMPSWAGSLANRFLSLATGSPKTTNGGYGPSSSESFATFDPESLSWRTCQGSLLPEWETYSETWPRAGMTRSGRAYRLPRLVPPISAGGSSSWPTPGWGDGAKSYMNPIMLKRVQQRFTGTVPTAPSGSEYQESLPEAVTLDAMKRRMWPTPSAQEAGGSDEWLATLETKDGEPAKPGERQYNPETGKHTQMGLSRAVRMWPTPTQADGMGGPGNSGRQGGENLRTAVAFPTPSSNDHKGSSKSGQRRGQLTDPAMGDIPAGGQLNPTWVEWLMGFPPGWTDLKDSETPSSPKQPNG